MKKVMSKIMFVFAFLTPLRAYAAQNKRFDQIMLEAILMFLGNISWPMFVIAIGMFVYAFKSEDGAMKINSLKMFGTALFLQSLFFIAKASGLC